MADFYDFLQILNKISPFSIGVDTSVILAAWKAEAGGSIQGQRGWLSETMSLKKINKRPRDVVDCPWA